MTIPLVSIPVARREPKNNMDSRKGGNGVPKD